jgi:Uma2 family endonuclease
MIAALTTPLQEFLERPDIEESPAWELLATGAQPKPMPTIEHSRLQKRLAALIDGSGTHEAIPTLRCIVGDLSPVPDLAIDTLERLPSRGAFAGAPLWVIEIRSPGQNTLELQAKILHFLQHGTQLAWLIDSDRNRITVWQGSEFDIFTDGDRLPALDLIRVSVNDVMQLVS